MSGDEILDIWMMEDKTDVNRAMLGTLLAEVFSIVIDTRATVEREIYGTIRVDDCNGSFYMYDVKREDSESITQNESLIIPQGRRVISAKKGFTMTFDLRDKNMEDVGFIRGSFRWKKNDAKEKRIVTHVGAESGSAPRATIEYAVFEGAIEANIWADFYCEDEIPLSCGLELDGTIVARYKYWYTGDLVHDIGNPNKPYEITLLDGGMSELHDRDHIQLDRSVVVLPIGWVLSIDVNMEGTNNEGKLITWKFDVQFSPEEIMQNTTYHEHRGEYGVLKFGSAGFHYHFSLEDVEGEKLFLRRTNRLRN